MKGPFYKSSNSGGTYWTRRWYTTSNGVKGRVPLPYNFTYGENLRVAPSLKTMLSAAYAAGYTGFASGITAAPFTALHNRAYSAWLDKLRGSIQLGADFAEAGQTLKMIQQTLKALRSPLRTLSKHAQKANVGAHLQTLGKGWLAWHFGVRPLVETLHELTELLEKQLFEKRQVTVVKKATLAHRKDSAGLFEDHSFKLYVRISGFVGVDDVNLATLESLGLINPAAVAWEVVPFSFVVDWFYPIGLYLQSLSATSGRTVTNGYVTWYYTGSLHFKMKWPQIAYNHPAYGQSQHLSCVGLQRTVGLPLPKLQKTTFSWSTSLTRAYTSISLLLQGIKFK